MNVKPCIPVAEFANFVAKMKGGTGFRTEYEVNLQFSLRFTVCNCSCFLQS
jgi:hypothetical protein